MEDRREETGRVGKGLREGGGAAGSGVALPLSQARPGMLPLSHLLGNPAKCQLALLLYSMFVRARDSLYEGTIGHKMCFLT